MLFPVFVFVIVVIVVDLFIYLLIYLLWSRGRERLEATSDGCNCAQSTVRAARAGMCVGSDCYMSELKGLLVVNLF